MTKLNEIYKCGVCGNIVTVVVIGGGALVCCGEEMELLKSKSKEEEGKEKHVPIIEKTEKGIKVKVGTVPHPMEEKHYIALVQLMKGDKVVMGKRLNPGKAPEAEFCCLANAEELRARILCNIHGVWES